MGKKILRYLDIREDRKHQKTTISDLNHNILSLLMEYLPDGITVTDLDGKITYVNEATKSFTGYSQEEMVGKTPGMLNAEVNAEETQQRIICLLKQGLKWQGNLHQQHKDGSIYPAELEIFPICKKDGTQVAWASIQRDISSKQLENEMDRLDRLDLIGEMAASFGHEIRNPMSVVRGFLQMLSGKAECAPFKDYYTFMIEELDRTNSIITEYLSLTKDKVIEVKKHNLNKIIESLFPLVLADAIHNDKNIELELQDIPDLLLDKKEIHQLILNLVRNGLEAMDEGGVVTIATYRDVNEAVISVQDQGKGIDPNVLSRLWTPFITTKENGTGLGLSVCYRIAQRHKAKIEIKTSPIGTTFYVRFTIPANS